MIKCLTAYNPTFKLKGIENILFASFDFPTYLASSLGKIEATTKSQHEKGVYLYII